MADIKRYTDAIREAVYGEEVRGSIADAIDAIDSESSIAYSSAISAQDSAVQSASNAYKSAQESQQIKLDVESLKDTTLGLKIASEEAAQSASLSASISAECKDENIAIKEEVKRDYNDILNLKSSVVSHSETVQRIEIDVESLKSETLGLKIATEEAANSAKFSASLATDSKNLAMLSASTAVEAKELSLSYKEETKTLKDDVERLRSSTLYFKDSAEVSAANARLYSASAFESKTIAENAIQDVNKYTESALSYKTAAEKAARDSELYRASTLIFRNEALAAYDEIVDKEETAKSWAVGPNGSSDRKGTDTNNAYWWYLQAMAVAQGLAGALLPMGTITFSQLPVTNVDPGYMYNISDSFTTDNRFREGPGHIIPAGANVYYTADLQWDVLAGTPVTGVKGEAETNYRIGNVNITPNDIGAVPSVSGKDLSSNDYTSEDKNKLSGIESGAQVNTVNSVNGLIGNVDLKASNLNIHPISNSFIDSLF